MKARLGSEEEIAAERARKSVADLRDKMEDEAWRWRKRDRGRTETWACRRHHRRGRSAPAASRTGSGGQHSPRSRCRSRRPFGSDVGVDNDPIAFNNGYVWYDVLGINAVA